VEKKYQPSINTVKIVDKKSKEKNAPAEQPSTTPSHSVLRAENPNPMSREPLKKITVGKTVKIFHEYLGGNKFESTELHSEESEEIPTTMDEQEVETVRQTLRARIDKDIANEIKKIETYYASLSRGGY